MSPKSKVQSPKSKGRSSEGLQASKSGAASLKPTSKLTHIDEQGRAKMVDVTGKETTYREAIARGIVKMRPETLRLIEQGKMKKGDVLTVAQVAGIMAAKKTSELIPMCHPLSLTGIDVNIELAQDKCQVEIEAIVRTIDKTGVEMEALTAVAAAALTIYDMCKAVEKEMVLTDIRLVKKSGGKSGIFLRSEK